MDVFLMIRRKKSTFFLDAKENTTVQELKRMIEGITKKPPGEQRLFNKEDAVMTSFFAYSLWGHFDQKNAHLAISIIFLPFEQFWMDLEMRLRSWLDRKLENPKEILQSWFTVCLQNVVTQLISREFFNQCLIYYSFVVTDNGRR